MVCKLCGMDTVNINRVCDRCMAEINKNRNIISRSKNFSSDEYDIILQEKYNLINLGTEKKIECTATGSIKFKKIKDPAKNVLSFSFKTDDLNVMKLIAKHYSIFINNQ